MLEKLVTKLLIKLQVYLKFIICNYEEISIPTVLKIGKYRFFFFSNETTEPAHVHIESDENYAKYWLEPVELAKSVVYNTKELNEIRKLILENVIILKEKWN